MALNKDRPIRTSAFPLILNSSNLIASTNNNVYRYNFPAGSVEFKKYSKIAVSSISMFYSWFNISADNNNNTYQIIQPTLAGSTTLTIIMPDGFYDVSALNTYLQYALIQAGFYLIDSSGNYVYYAQWQTNTSLYAVEYDAFPVPTALPSGYTNPASMTFPATASVPQLVVQANDFQNNIGFDADTYPTITQSTTYSVTSTFTPQITSIESMIVMCSLLRNIYASPNQTLYAFSAGGVSFGDLINSAPNQLVFINIFPGQYPSFDITFVDQNFNPLPIQDTNLVIQLIIEQEDDYNT